MLSVVSWPDPVLTRACHDVTLFDDELKKIVEEMAMSMYASGGVGLAAPQVGLDERVVVIDPSGGEEANQFLALINPRVTWRSPETKAGEEGCLSMPGVVVVVQRAVAIDVEYCDVMGKLVQLRCTGLRARIVQHEVDHLDGVMMMDRVGSLARKHALRDLGKKR